MTTDLETRLRDALSEKAAVIRTSPDLPHGLRRRIRRRRTTTAVVRSTAVIALVGALAGAAVSLRQDDPRTVTVASTDLATTSMSDGPLAPRVGATAAWSDAGFFVWGGSLSNQADGTLAGDGALFDPRTGSWRTVSPSPLSPRTGAVSVWTPQGLLVWGGSDAPTPVSPRDGVLYDPASDSWRPIAPAPSGRVFAHAALINGSVVIAGGTNPTLEDDSALIYDLGSDTWTSIPVGIEVNTVAATPTGLVVAGRDHTTGHIHLAEVNPTAGTATNLPDFEPDIRPTRLGLAANRGELLLAVTYDGITQVLTLPPGGAWRETLTVDAEAFHPPVHLGFDPDTTPMVWTGNTLLAASERGVEALDLDRHEVATLNIADADNRHCGAGSAEAWSGQSLYTWGGQSCIASGPAEVATGLVLTP